MNVIVGWLVSANCADSPAGNKFVIGEEFLRPWNRKVLQIGKTGYQKKLFIVRKDHRTRLSFLREQVVRSSEQLVLVDTKKVFRPCQESPTVDQLDQQSHTELPEKTSGLRESRWWTLRTYAKMNYLSDFGICNNSH